MLTLAQTSVKAMERSNVHRNDEAGAEDEADRHDGDSEGAEGRPHDVSRRYFAITPEILNK